MFYKRKNQLQRWWFDRRINGIVDTPPIRLGEQSAPALLSQLQRKDVLMYLAALKSFASRLPPREVHVVDDGSLDTSDRALIAEHVPGVTFHPLLACRDPALPAGGTWERLIAIARLSEDRYVIQLDADTLTLGHIDEVAQTARAGRSFSIGTWDNQTIEAASERAQTARAHLGAARPHIQVLAEASLDRIGEGGDLKYVRGCSGFSGFAASPGKLDFIRDRARELKALLGERWLEWGSEQVMSNLVVANQPDARVLPHPAYADCEKVRPGVTRFVHFIGTCRFRQGRYANWVRQTLLDTEA